MRAPTLAQRVNRVVRAATFAADKEDDVFDAWAAAWLSDRDLTARGAARAHGRAWDFLRGLRLGLPESDARFKKARLRERVAFVASSFAESKVGDAEEGLRDVQALLDWLATQGETTADESPGAFRGQTTVADPDPAPAAPSKRRRVGG